MEMTNCTHRNIQAWSYPDGPADFWSCANCSLKFVPITREIELERELAAAQKDAARYRWLVELDAAIDAAMAKENGK
jgi:hypothetical protein